MTRTGRPRSTAADAAILRAARELLVERGVGGASIEEIARRAEVSKVTVYRRWSSREALLAAAVESSAEGLPGRTHREADPAELDPDMTYDQMTALIESALPQAARTLATPGYRALLAQAFGSRFTHPGVMAAYWDNHILPRRRVALPVLRRAVTEGHLPPGTDVEALLDMTVGALLYRLLQPGDITPEEMLDHLRRVYRQAGLLRS
ncbi:TetR/AcrR family transcriptional regulator [Myceligenerans pegani]|uniref:TetR/AcrR family transcriptional regulator n=1 Tax=Myceligenerans pegani TaxID=2776917 RepID=A0ABR9N0V5_9MICO|nr:TetR/AcrR family transcriptional regulator [Myceligenerans sp. TRM 65318]MBE1877289.1 TetR/AcrR family transcriptional regulator [Myceligenerans sp. TRM 65318]MBE3019560.1 TetR/AcrR family transcriptional regulator [Myceligenerans sp. TRM 65318]